MPLSSVPGNVQEAPSLTVFLAERLEFGGPSWLVGVSSNHMIIEALGGPEVPEFYYPSDRGDMGRCEATYLRAPASLRPKLRPIMERYRTCLKKLDEERGRVW